MTTDEHTTTASLADWADQRGYSGHREDARLAETFLTPLERDKRGMYLTILGWDVLGFGERQERYGFLNLRRRTVYTLSMLAPKG